MVRTRKYWHPVFSPQRAVYRFVTGPPFHFRSPSRLGSTACSNFIMGAILTLPVLAALAITIARQLVEDRVHGLSQRSCHLRVSERTHQVRRPWLSYFGLAGHRPPCQPLTTLCICMAYQNHLMLMPVATSQVTYDPPPVSLRTSWTILYPDNPPSTHRRYDCQHGHFQRSGDKHSGTNQGGGRERRMARL